MSIVAKQNQGGEPPRDPWRAYHLIVAVLTLVSVVAGVANLSELFDSLDHMNRLEESGLAASFILVCAGVKQYAMTVARWLGRMSGR